MKKVLVAGATGYLGKYVIKEFKKQGYWVRALTRSSEKLASIREFIDELIIGEVTKPDSLQGICKDIDIVFSSIGITKQKDGLTYRDVDYQANKNLLNVAIKQDVKRFIYVSVFNARELRHLKIVEAKELFVDELKKSNIESTVIRPNGFFSDMSEFFNMAKKGRVYVFGDGNYRGNPIHGADLAKVCVDSLTSDKQDVDVGGPAILTQNEIAQMAFDVLNEKPKITHIPDWLRKLSLFLIRTITPEKTYGPLEFFMTVLATDMIAPIYGEHHLRDFFMEIKK
jgi:uncharacterized protein YbjT (DUF2867 family)